MAIGAITRTYGYTAFVAFTAAVALAGLSGTFPVTDPVYAPMAVALAVGLLLTVRLVPLQLGGALVVLPAMAADARFGLVALPMLAYVALVINLVRGMRGARLVSTAAHLVLAFALAHGASQVVRVGPSSLVFAVVFVGARFGLWKLAERLDFSPED